MTILDLRADFSRFRGAAPRRINFAAHSHHEWPDVTFEAQMRCWDDAARLAGGKWRLVLGEIPTNSYVASSPALRRTAPFASSRAMPNFIPYAAKWRGLKRRAS
jgi:hypothetical protein